MSPEELHLMMIRFESRVGSGDHLPHCEPELPELSCSNLKPIEEADVTEGYVQYSNTPEGWIVKFVDAQPTE